MPGTLRVKLTPGCYGDTALMVLSGAAEPNGDHYASVNWYFYPIMALVSIELEQTPGVWIAAPSAFLFTELGETYNLRATGPASIVSKIAGRTFPYKVTGMYAPDWASVYGDILAEEDTDACCVPVGETSTEQNIWNGSIIGAAGYSSIDGACGIRTTPPWLFFSGCTTATGTYTANITPSITIYDWLDKSFSLSHTFTFTHSLNGIGSTFAITMTFTKSAGIAYMVYAHNYTGSAGGTIADPGSLPSLESTTPAEILLDIPCSLYKIRIAIASERLVMSFSVGSVYLQADTGLIGVEFYRA
jgi:hypothetical protein